MKQLYLDELYWKSRRLEKIVCSKEAISKLRKIVLYKRLRSEGCSEATALQTVGMSRATYFRWKKSLEEKDLQGLDNGSKRPKSFRKRTWTLELQNLVFKLRQENPLYGRLKIHAVLRRDFSQVWNVSVTTIGRILKKLLELQWIKPIWILTASKKTARRREFQKHAKRWRYGMKAEKPGEMVQLDHMSVSLETSRTVKHFQATCPLTKITITEVCSNATSAAAAKFLKKMKAQFPFPLRSIQVDGGSEFMKDFEAACQTENIPLYVLPPKSPKYNGCVERRNGTFKYEFYYQYGGEDTIEAIRASLEVYQTRYNTFRPHQALNLKTPMDYYEKHYAMAA